MYEILWLNKMLFVKNISAFPLKFWCYETHFHRNGEKSDFFFIIIFCIYSSAIPHMYTTYPDHIHPQLLPTTPDFPSPNIFLLRSCTHGCGAIHWAWATHQCPYSPKNDTTTTQQLSTANKPLVMVRPHKPLPNPWGNVGRSDLSQVLGREPQLLWVHKSNSHKSRT